MKLITFFAVAFIGCASAQTVPVQPVVVEGAYENLPPPPPPPSVLEPDPQIAPGPVVKYEPRCGKLYPEDRNDVWQGNHPCWKVHKFYEDMLYVHAALNMATRSTEDLRRFFCNGELLSLRPPKDWRWRYDYLLERVMLEEDPVEGVQNVKSDLRRFGKGAFCEGRIDRGFVAKFANEVRKFGVVEDPGLIWR